MTETKQNSLGTEPIGRLLLKFSVPTALTLMVNCLYNIVDQIFIGHAVGIKGVAATNVTFPIGIIAAAFSNSDSALTAMTTSVCVDLLRTDRDVEEVALRRRGKVHITLSVILVFFICLVEALNSKSVIDAIYIIASYTYGPLLGMFAFGLFTRRRTRDRWVPFIAVASPILCYALDRFAMQSYGYKFGYELLMLNGMLTFAGMYALSSKELKNKEHGNIKC